MSNSVLDRVNDRRMIFDFEESHKYCSTYNYYLATKIKEDDDIVDIVETLLLFQEQGINAFYHYDIESVVHEYQLF